MPEQLFSANGYLAENPGTNFAYKLNSGKTLHMVTGYFCSNERHQAINLLNDLIVHVERDIEPGAVCRAVECRWYAAVHTEYCSSEGIFICINYLNWIRYIWIAHSQISEWRILWAWKIYYKLISIIHSLNYFNKYKATI